MSKKNPTVDLSSLQLGDFVSKTTRNSPGIVSVSKHKVINFTPKFLVLDTNEKLDYSGNRYPQSKAYLEYGLVLYDIWQDGIDEEFSRKDYYPVIQSEAKTILDSLEAKFPKVGRNVLRALLAASIHLVD